MIGYFKRLFKGVEHGEYNNVRIRFVEGVEYQELLKILSTYPGSAVSKESRDEEGNALPSGTRGIIFRNKDQRAFFLAQYGEKYDAVKFNEYLPTKVKAPSYTV